MPLYMDRSLRLKVTNVGGSSAFSFPLSSFFFLYSFSKPKLKENNPQNRASMYMFVHVLEIKKNTQQKTQGIV